MFEETISLVSTWTSMTNWFTPTYLFLFLNFMIATIFFTSSFTSPIPPQQPPQQQHHQHQQQQQPSSPTQISRVPSLLHRLKSINFYSQPSTPQIPSPKHKPKPEPESKSSDRVWAWATSINEEKVDDDGEGEEEGEGPTLEEIYSRIKGIIPGHSRQKSDTVPFGGDIPVKLPAKIRKSASDKSAFNHFEAAEDTVERENIAVAEAAVTSSGEVDSMADDFISRFKKQLQLQRVESIMRYKDMITRGSAK